MKNVLKRKRIPIAPGPTRVCAFAKRRQDVRERRVADDDEDEVHGNHDQELAIAGDRPESSSPGAGVRRRGAWTRHHREYGQRERGVGDRVEHIQRLKRPQVLCRGDDEPGDRRPDTEAEVLRDAPERERGGTLLWRYQGDEQRLVRGAGRADPGTGDDRASERLPRPVDERKAGIAERARKVAGDQDRLGTKVIEQGSRGRCREGGCAQDRGKHQTGGGRREPPDLVQVDDLEREDQPIAEEADRIPCKSRTSRGRSVRQPLAGYSRIAIATGPGVSAAARTTAARWPRSG
jgi:hypothetical protein